jgi:hypothetical protein
MSTVFVEAVRNFMMPGGGQAGTGEIVSLDPATAASRIASGDAVSSGAPGAFVPAPTTRVKMTGARGSIMVNGSPPLYAPGDVATFLSPISAALIASGDAVAN